MDVWWVLQSRDLAMLSKEGQTQSSSEPSPKQVTLETPAEKKKAKSENWAAVDYGDRESRREVTRERMEAALPNLSRRADARVTKPSTIGLC
jgi:hypothetical protein